MKLQQLLVSFLLLFFVGTTAYSQDTTSTSQGTYFLDFVKKVYFNPTILLETQEFREATNVRALVLPDMNGAEENQITGFERGMQKIIRFLIEGDDEGAVRLYFDAQDSISPFSFVCSEEIWCKFSTADKDSIERRLNAPFQGVNYTLNSSVLFDNAIQSGLSYAKICLQRTTAECGDRPDYATTEINTKPLSISLHNTSGSRFDIDNKQHDQLASWYAKANDVHTQQEWYAPAKFLVSGTGTAEPVVLAIDRHESLFKKENFQIKTLYNDAVLMLKPGSTNDSLRIDLPADLPVGNPVEIVVKYTSPIDSIQYTVGFFMVYVYEPQTVVVNILSASPAPIAEAELTDIRNELKKIYDPLGVSFTVQSKSWLPDSEWPQQIVIESSGLLSNYPPDLRDWVGGVQDLPDYDDEQYYLVLGLSSGSEYTGYMPRARNIGFIFTEADNKGKTCAHELGHGAFHLRHIFSDEELGPSKLGATENVMDYTLKQEDLYLHQWQFISDPAFVSWFDNDENSTSVNVGITSDIFNKFKNVDGSLTFLSPAGKPITIPKETSTVRFSLPDDKWVYNTIDGFVETESSYTPVGALVAFTVNDVFYYAQTSGGAFSGYKYRTSEQVEKPYKEIKSKTLNNFIPVIAVPIFDQEGFKISICQIKYNKSHYASSISDSNEAKGNLDDFYKFFSYTTKELLKNGYITNITHLTTAEFTNETVDFLKVLLTTPSPGEITSAFPIVIGNIFENSGFYCTGLDATTLFIAALNYQQLSSYGECLEDLNQVITRQSFQQVVYANDAEQNKGFYERLENDPVVKYADRLKPKLPDISQRIQFFDQSMYSDYVNKRLKMIFLSLRKFNSFAERFIANAQGFEEVIEENDIAVLIEMYDFVNEHEGEDIADCLIQMLSAKTKLEILKKHKEWTLLDDKEEMVTKVLSLASAEDFELIYPELMKDNYALLQSLEGDLWASEYDLFCNSLAVQFYYRHVYNNTLNINSLPVFPLYKENYGPGIVDQYSEGNFDDDGVDLFSYIFGFGNDRELEDKSPDKMYRFVLMEDFSFPGWNGQKLREGDTIVAPIYWAYYLVDEEQDKVNWGLITKTVEAVLIIASAGTLAPEIVLIESMMAGTDFVINVAADYAPHNSEIHDFQQKFQVLYAVYGVTALTTLAINVNWISMLQKGGRILYTFRPNNFIPMLKELKSISLAKVDDLITRLDEAIKTLQIARNNTNMIQGAKIESFIAYLAQCKRLAIFSRYHNTNLNHGNFFVHGRELFFKFTKSTHGINNGYTIRISKIWDDADNGIYLSDLNLYNASSDGTVILDDVITLSTFKLKKPSGSFANVDYRIIITSQGKVRMISKASLDGLINASSSIITKIENLQLSSLIAKINLLDEPTKAMFNTHFSGLSNVNLTRMNNFPNCIDIWKIHSEAGRLSLAQNFDIWMKHLESRQFLKTGNYNEVAQIFNDQLKTYPSGYVVNDMTMSQINSCNQIINSSTDVQLISLNTDIPENVIQQVKNHYWIKSHVVKTEEGLFFGRFSKDDYDIEIWLEAQNGFQNSNLSEFKKLIAHEYIESKLMEFGMNYRSLDKPFELNVYNLGAHDLSPLLSNGSFYNPGYMNVVSEVATDLSNLDLIVNELKLMYKL